MHGTLEQVSAWFGNSGARRLQVACVLVAVVTLLARIPFIVNPGMSTDSYAYLDGWPTWEQFAAQGRFGLYMVFRLFEAFAVDPRTFGTLLQGLGIAVFGLSAPLLFAAFSVDRQIRILPLCIGGLVVTLHPYAAEMLTFSEASFTASVAAAMGIVAIFLVARRPERWWLSVLLLVGALSIYQLLVNYACLLILFGALKIHLRTEKEARWSLAPYRGVMLAIGVLALSLLIYLVLQKAILAALDIKQVGRAAFLPLDRVGTRIDDLRTLTAFLWSRPLLVEYGGAARALLWLMVSAGWSAFAVYTIGRFRSRAVLPIIVMALVPLAGIGVVTVGAVWWPVPRILGGIVVVWAMGIYWLAWLATGRSARVLVAIAAGMLLLSMAAVGHRVHSDQKQLNVYDRALAQRVYTALSEVPGYTDETTITLVNTRLRWAHPLRLATAYMDLNLTAFADKVAHKGLLELSNGRRLNVVPANEEDVRYCERSPSWPQPGFVTLQDGRARVCL